MSADKYPNIFLRQMKAIVYIFTVLRTERKMARCFAKVSKEEIKTAFFYPSDLVNTKTTVPLRVGVELRVSVYIHLYSPPLRGIVVYYSTSSEKRPPYL